MNDQWLTRQLVRYCVLDIDEMPLMPSPANREILIIKNELSFIYLILTALQKWNKNFWGSDLSYSNYLAMLFILPLPYDQPWTPGPKGVS